jgi:hypothetical protein
MNLFDLNLPGPYWLTHCAVALCIFFGVSVLAGHPAGFWAAITFYVSRELRDWEKLGHVDWWGFLPPTVAVLVAFIITPYIVAHLKEFLSS